MVFGQVDEVASDVEDCVDEFARAASVAGAEKVDRGHKVEF